MKTLLSFVSSVTDSALELMKILVDIPICIRLRKYLAGYGVLAAGEPSLSDQICSACETKVYFFPELLFHEQFNRGSIAGTTTSYLESRLLSNIYLHLYYVRKYLLTYILLLGKLFVIAFSNTHISTRGKSLEWHFSKKILVGNSMQTTNKKP